MTPTAFQQWCKQLALPASTCKLLADTRRGDPVRRVTSRGSNMSGYPAPPTACATRVQNETLHSLKCQCASGSMRELTNNGLRTYEGCGADECSGLCSGLSFCSTVMTTFPLACPSPRYLSARATSRNG
jgi:hypothetical protein